MGDKVEGEVRLAFLSYTSFDDRNDEGWISMFHKRLEGELQALTGTRLTVFRDQTDIRGAARWQGVISRNLEESPLFIPLLTPSYFRSEWCRHELLTAVINERRFGVSELIYPIHYIPCDELRKNEDPLARVLRRRQIYDWTGLRAVEHSDSLTRRSVHQLASDMKQFMDEFSSDRVTPPDDEDLIALLAEAASVGRLEAVLEGLPPRDQQRLFAAAQAVADEQAGGAAEEPRPAPGATPVAPVVVRDNSPDRSPPPQQPRAASTGRELTDPSVLLGLAATTAVALAAGVAASKVKDWHDERNRRATIEATAISDAEVADIAPPPAPPPLPTTTSPD